MNSAFLIVNKMTPDEELIALRRLGEQLQLLASLVSLREMKLKGEQMREDVKNG